MSAVKPVMKIKLDMTGSVNKRPFKITGTGEGMPFDGTHTIDLEVIEGGPLPFAYDILTTAFEYGNRAFTKYPDDIEDFFKQSFPEGFRWTRTMTFEDGGVCDVANVITMEGDTFKYDITFTGKNLDRDGPIMKKKTRGWEPSYESMYAVKDKVLQGDVFRHLLLEGGGHYRCDFRTTYTTEKSVTMPNFHYIAHRIEILSHDKDYNKVKVHEIAKALKHPLAK